MFYQALNRCMISRKPLMKTIRNEIQKRHSGGGNGYTGYREINYAPERLFYQRAQYVLGTALWWWIFWNFLTDYKHLIGEFPWPEQSSWTDKELGIPPDDQE